MQQDSIHIDSIIVKMADFCSTLYTDTLFIFDHYNQLLLLSSDTSLAIMNLDSVNILANFKVYPNPTTGPFTIEIPIPWDSEYLDIEMYDEQGELMFRETKTTRVNKRRINISTRPDGFYNLILKIGKSRIYSEKVVKSP